MEASKQIRTAITQVQSLRRIAIENPSLGQALTQIKKFQSDRFSATYKDLVESPTYSACATFFLDELYSCRDFRQRDEQFSRIAGTIERTLPSDVVQTTVALAQLHLMTEEFDLQMATHWANNTIYSDLARYKLAWQLVGDKEKRAWQLETVLTIGKTLSELTQKKGLRLLLKMMRSPAEIAGLGALQKFLEIGFDRFNQMAKHENATEAFLQTIRKRESEWMACMFENNTSCYA